MGWLPFPLAPGFHCDGVLHREKVKGARAAPAHQPPSTMNSLTAPLPPGPGPLSGGDEIPDGTFHGGDEIPDGTFH